MDKWKVKKFLAGLLCAAMLAGNWSSTIAFAANEPVFEETQKETASVSEETQKETVSVSEETQEEISPESEETSETPDFSGTDDSTSDEAESDTPQSVLKKPVFSGDWTKVSGEKYVLIGLGGVVKLTAEDQDAAIYYTMDGSEPTAKSKRYTGPITVFEDNSKESKVIKAVAVREGYENSEIAVMEFYITSDQSDESSETLELSEDSDEGMPSVQDMSNQLWNDLEVEPKSTQALLKYKVQYDGFIGILYTTDSSANFGGKEELTSSEWGDLEYSSNNTYTYVSAYYLQTINEEWVNGSYNVTRMLTGLEPDTTYYFRAVGYSYVDGSTTYSFLTDKVSFTTTVEPEESQLSIGKFEVKESGFAAAKVSLIVNNPEGESYDVKLVDEKNNDIGDMNASDERPGAGKDAWTGIVDFENKDSLKVKAQIEKDGTIVTVSDTLTVTRKNKSGFNPNIETKITGSSVAFSLKQTPYYAADNDKIKVTLTYRKEGGTETTANSYPYNIYNGTWDQTLTGLEENKKYNWTLTCEAGSATLLTKTGAFTTGQVITYTDADFPDAALLAAIKSELGDDKPLTNVNLAGITSLYCSADNGEVITNLKGIQYLTGLRTLSITGHDITSADQVSGLTELKSLNLRSNDLQTMPDLSKNTALENIYLTYNLLPAEEITAAKLPDSFKRKNPNWINVTRGDQRPKFSTVTAEEYYATGDNTWPFIVKFEGLKKQQKYTLTATVGGKPYTKEESINPLSDGNLMIIQGIDNINVGQQTVTYTLKGADDRTYCNKTVTCSFVESTDDGTKNYLKGTETNFYCTVQLDRTKADALGDIARLELVSSGGARVGASVDDIYKYPLTYDNRYVKVFGDISTETGYAAVQYSGTIRLANYLGEGSYDVRIVGTGGKSELLKDVVEVPLVSVINSVSAYGELGNTGDYCYLEIRGKNLDPKKVNIKLTNSGGMEIAKFAEVLQKGSDSMVYKYKKNTALWDEGDMIGGWALENGDCLDNSTSHNVYFSDRVLLLLHYNYKKKVVEAKLSSRVKDGTKVTLTISDKDLQSYNNAEIYGSGTGTVKNSWLQLKLTDSEGKEYIPPASQYGNYVYIKLEYGDRTEYQQLGISWYNYTGSGTVWDSGNWMSVLPVRTSDMKFSVKGSTTKLKAGATGKVELLSNGSSKGSWDVTIGSGGSFTKECDLESSLSEGSYVLRLTAAAGGTALRSCSLIVYNKDKFYLDDQWGSYDKTKNSIWVAISSNQIYGERSRKTDGIDFTNCSDYTVEVYDRLGTEIDNASLEKAETPASLDVVNLTIKLPDELKGKNYTGFYVKIKWKGQDGHLTSNPAQLFYESDTWSYDPKYGGWMDAAGNVDYYFQKNTTTSHGIYGLYCTDVQTASTDLPLTVKVYEAQTETLKKSIKISKLDSNGIYRFSKTDLTGLDESTIYNLELWTKSDTMVDRETGYIVLESSTSTPAPAVTYTVDFDLQGHGSGAAYAAKTVQGGKTVAQPAKPTEKGWKFGGWYTDAECTAENQWNFSTGKVNGDMTLYAKWERDAMFCFVTFDTSGAESNAPAMQTVSKGGKLAEPDAPVKAGYVFTGWYTDAECTAENPWNFSADKVNADMTLYAGWVAPIEMGKVETPKAHILNYDGGEVETGTKVFLTTGTNGAKIYYTTDGSSPTRESALYTDAIVISEDMIIGGGEVEIRAFAVMESDETGRKYEDSDIMEVSYSVKDESQDWGDVTGNDLEEEFPEDAASIPKGLWVAGIPESTPYTGKKITFGVRVYDHKKLLTEKKDYTVTYKDNQNVALDGDGEPIAKATVTITGKGNYSGSIVKKFTITPLNIDGEDFTADDILLAPTGSVQKATPTLRWKGTALKKDTAFKVSYPDADTDTGAYKEEGEWEITLTGKGNFTGERSVTESIVTGTLMSKVSIGKIGNQKYTGEPIEPHPTVKVGKKNLKEDEDYSLEWENNTDVGTAKVTITGEGDYIGTVTKTFKITGTALNASKLKNFAGSMPYTGEALEQSSDVTFDYGTKAAPKLLQGIPAEEYDAEEPDRDYDYTIEYENNTEIGTATVIYKGINGYTGTVKKTFKITGNTFSDKTVTIDGFKGTLPYTGEAVVQECTLTLKADNTALEEGTHYSVSYTKNTDAGTATVTYKGINAYTGTIKKTYKITAYNWKDDAAAEEKRITVSMNDVVYAKDGVNPVPTVTYTYNGESRELVSGKDYKISYGNNKAAKVLAAGDKKNPALTLTGKGNFAGAYKVEFSIKEQDLGNLEGRITVQDVKYQNKANIYKSAPTVTDLNGKKLKSGTDYTVSYTYAEPVFVSRTGNKTAVTLRGKNAQIDSKDIIPVGAVIKVTVTGKGNYTGSAAATFRFAKENLSGATVKVADQYFKGRAVEPAKDQMTVKIGKTVLSKEDYEITDYTNNVKKGTAKVTLRGLGNYGGTKTVTFKIKDRTMGYTIVFDGNGATGGSMVSQLIASTAGKKLTANKFKKTGYKFVGWTTVQEPGDEEDVRYTDKELFPGQKGGYISGSAIILYAQWEPEKYKITYKLDNGTLPGEEDEPELYYYTIESGFDLSSVAPEREGYEFVGWYTDSRKTKPADDIEEGTTGNKTFYAKWVKE